MTTIRHNGNLLALLCLSGVGLLAPGLAHAQDADGDGVPDVRDVCPTTPPATTVDGAGCDAFCEVVDSTSDVFLRSRLLEVGTHAAGSFGSSIAPPASWHARVTGASTDRLGFVANPQADGWTNYNGDFFVPGTPEEGFGLSIGGRNYYNGGLVGSNGIAGGFTGTRVECLPLVCGRRGGGSVFWSGAVAGINVDHTYSVLNEGLFILVEVTLTNTTGAAQTVTYLRNVDPDNQRPLTGVYATRNTIISQGDGTAASLALVSAETDAVPGVADASYIALLSSDPDARVTYGGFSNRNPNDVFDCTGGLTCATGSSTTRDIAISLAVRKTIPAGRSVTFSYAYTLDVVSVATSAACTVPAICGDGVVEGTESCDDGGTAAGDGCDPTCNFEPGYVCTGSPSVCVPDCGDGMIVGAETCDDGGTAAGDGCSATCTIESGYGCMGAPSTCAPVCGDGMIVGAETCDDGGTAAGDGCSATCTIESGYGCMGAPSTCAPVCGDGMIVGAETCDDGGTAAGDGCSATCTIESGYGCMGAPSTCAPVCGDGMIIGAETCDDGGTAAGDGCSATCTIESGYGCMGAPSTCAPVCGDGMIIGAETCDDGGTTAGDGCSDACALETGFVCVGTPSVCGICVDTEAGATADLGCMAGAPICVGSGVTAFCAPCVDDTSGGMDTGCAATAPSCDTSGAPAHLCQACEDTAADAGVDNGCVAATPVCGTGSAGAPTCFECVTDAHCSTGTVCNAAGACVPGCADDSDCVPSPATPLCDITARSCVECLADTDCTGTEICSASSACTSIDTDGDGVPDADDLDDDNDGIPDTSEVDPSLVGDSDDDGVLDYEDPDFVTCTDADANGVCDELPESVDFDQDGIANHLDLDADGDGVNDLVEGGGEDTNGDGLVDDFVDGNGDGLNDAYAASPLPLPNTDGTDGPDFLDVDDDGDGVNTIFEGPTAQDTDGDGTPDYLDADDDGDGMPTVDENADPNGDGDPADALDTDGDGTPDYLDPADNSDAGMSDGGMADGGDAGTLDGSVPSGGGVSGGALCSASPGPGRSAPIWLIFSALLSILVVRRRRS